MSTVPDKLYYRIGEVETITEIPAYVLRYWESEFKLLLRIKSLLYEERLTLEGAKKRLRSESRGLDQMDLGLRGATLEDALKRTRSRLQAIRQRLAAPRSGRSS